MSTDERLDRVIADYLRAVAAGEKPDAADWLQRHPHLADELREFFADRARLEALAGPWRDTPAGLTPTVGPETAAAPEAAGSFGDYEVRGVIARGGMGVVYRARQVSANREVALKMILAGQLASEDQVRRFRAE